MIFYCVIIIIFVCFCLTGWVYDTIGKVGSAPMHPLSARYAMYIYMFILSYLTYQIKENYIYCKTFGAEATPDEDGHMIKRCPTWLSVKNYFHN